MKLEEKLGRDIKEHQLVCPGEKLVVAVSGGADSVALLHALLQVTAGWPVHFHVAHLNHLLRGEEAAAEADFVARLADSRGLERTVASVDAAAHQRAAALSPEEAARQVRYHFLRATAAKIGAAGIITAHHRDDQAETVLLHLLRGSGTEGLAGMAPRENDLRRPFLAVSKAEILAYCRENQLTYCTDSSNLQPSFRRNRLRLELLPALGAYNPRVADSLSKTAEICRAENNLLDELAGQALAAISQECGEKRCLAYGRLRELPLALQRRVLRLVFDHLAGSQGGLTFEQTERLRLLDSCREISLPQGIQARREYQQLLFWRRGGSRDQGKTASKGLSACRLTVPGWTAVPDLGIAVTTEIVSRQMADRPAAEVPTGYFSLAALAAPLEIRSRQPGDRFRPAGLGGEKKLKEFLIDAKIPRAEREDIPLLLSGGRIIWVVGCRFSAEMRPGQEERQVLAVRVEKLSGD